MELVGYAHGKYFVLGERWAFSAIRWLRRRRWSAADSEGVKERCRSCAFGGRRWYAV